MRLVLITAGVLLISVLVIAFGRLLGQVKPPKVEVLSFFDQAFTIVAHRGGALEAPENTIVAFERAASIAPDIAFEFDVHLSKDQIPVVFHDDTLERTTNGEGKLRNFTLQELKLLDAGYHFKDDAGNNPYRGSGIQIPTLDEVLSKFPDRKMAIEIKVETPEVEIKIIEIIKKHKAQDRVLIASQLSRVIERFRRLEPDWFYGASYDDVLRGVMLTSLFLEPAGSWPGHAYLIPEKNGVLRVLRPQLIKECHRRNKKVLIWTVNHPDDMQRLKQMGVDGLISDRPSVAYAYKNQ